jgi:hypothetical protein
VVDRFVADLVGCHYVCVSGLLTRLSSPLLLGGIADHFLFFSFLPFYSALLLCFYSLSDDDYLYF